MKPMEITLCRGEGCCPVLSISEKGARITDDNGGEVTISNNELQILKEKLNELDNICQSVTIMSMERRLYYDTVEEVCCFMASNDARLKKERGWILWDDYVLRFMLHTDDEDEDDYERELREAEEAEEDLKCRDEEDFDEWGNPIQYGR